jgi:hypothetical protein
MITLNIMPYKTKEERKASEAKPHRVLQRKLYNAKKWEEHKEELKKTHAKYYKANREHLRGKATAYRNANLETVREKDRKRYANQWPAHALSGCKQRAKEKGLDFNLTIEDITVPEYCPILGLKLQPSEGTFSHSSPSVDRINNTKGYVKGNVWVISRRANVLKSDATFEELKKIVAAWEKVQSCQ